MHDPSADRPHALASAPGASPRVSRSAAGVVRIERPRENIVRTNAPPDASDPYARAHKTPYSAGLAPI